MRPYDIALLGLTGFTGRLVAGELLTLARTEGLKLAFAARNREKAEAVRASLVARWPEAADVPIVVTDTSDPASVDALVRSTRVVVTTVGPYARYGPPVVEACARLGTHYCDLTGEVQFMRAMIDAHQDAAVASGARIVFACGYDSIPSDLGTWFTQRAFQARFGRPASRVTALAGEASGGFSGGTIASMANIFDEAANNPEIRRILGRPYGLNPDPTRRGPDGSDRMGVYRAPRVRMWTAPFVMAPTNSRVVRRAHAIAGEPWGSGFQYEERMTLPGGVGGWFAAWGITLALGGFFGLMVTPLRPWLMRRLPAPEKGPSEEARAKGHWKMRFVAEDREDWLLTEVSDPNGDPGYASTARMLAASAVCLARDPSPVGGGMWTPSTALGEPLLKRLTAAGLRFVDDAKAPA